MKTLTILGMDNFSFAAVLIYAAFLVGVYISYRRYVRFRKKKGAVTGRFYRQMLVIVVLATVAVTDLMVFRNLFFDIGALIVVSAVATVLGMFVNWFLWDTAVLSKVKKL